ncbi:MAG TPA: alpha-amylase family glycosyl hydrolase [Acidimicrobiia bacterium]|nr:alpha-amylase family glycosyl hydrolase [Acidimicrobiia bacterium]
MPLPPGTELGAVPRSGGQTEFRVWAPAARSVEVRLDGGGSPLTPEGGGFWATALRAAPGERYAYVLDGSRELADPCSRCQPDGLLGRSQVVEAPRVDRLGLALEELVIYELHVGAFSDEGTFDGAIPYLPALRELGVTAIELMPVATFPGSRGWGYDGVYAYAPHHSYGGPSGLVRLVEAAHREGLGVILDVVYNHIGPGSDALNAFGPYLTAEHATAWGPGVDFTQAGVREWAIRNALMWVESYGIDGLRLDAVHAIRDGSRPHVLAELADRVHATDPRALVLAETFPGDERPVGQWGHDGRWDDGLHHALHALLTGERDGHYAAYGSIDDVVRELSRTPAERQVVYAQDHDQVGNRAFGDRLAPELLRVASSVVLFAAQTPLIFMGEEYGEANPFRFFTDHVDPAAAAAARAGRRREFAAYPGFDRADLPDPQDPATFRASKLSRRESPAVRARYRRLLGLRRRLPREVRVETDGSVLTMRRGDAALVVDFDARTAELRA